MRKYNLTRCVAAACAGVLVSGAALAADAGDELSYTYLEGSYLILDVDAFDEDGSFIEDIDDGGGPAIRGSLEFTDHLFGFGGFSSTDSDVTYVDGNGNLISSNQDIKRLELGLGAHFPILQGDAPRTDLVGKIGYTDIDFGDFDFGGSSSANPDDLDDDNSDGYFLEGGVRSQLTNWLEAGAGIRYTEMEDIDDVSFIANALFELTPSWEIDVGVDAGDEISTYMFGVRYSFGAY